jgi:alcohol dehydrogenase
MGEGFPVVDIQNQPLHLGDQVTWAIVANCGSCFYCLRGLEQKCEHASKYGHMGFASQHELSGGLAEYCVLSAGTHTIKLPDDALLEVFTPASCATATVMAALDALSPPPSMDSHIAIIGAGMLGLTACAVAKSSGWKRVVAVDPVPGKRETALRFGATHAHSPEDWVSESKKNGVDGCDAVIEMSGAQSMIQPAMESLRVGGELVLVGAVFPVPAVSLLPEQVIRRHMTIRGIHNYRPDHLRSAVEFLTEFGSAFPFAEMVASWHSLGEVEALVQTGLPSHVVRIGVRP